MGERERARSSDIVTKRGGVSECFEASIILPKTKKFKDPSAVRGNATHHHASFPPNHTVEYKGSVPSKFAG